MSDKSGSHKTVKRREESEADAPPIGDRLLTLQEAADVLRLSTLTLREYVSRGAIEGRIIGGRWRFRRADLDAFFANPPRNWDFAGKNGDGD
jgi:excisionase family DNA binding protein